MTWECFKLIIYLKNSKIDIRNQADNIAGLFNTAAERHFVFFLPIRPPLPLSPLPPRRECFRETIRTKDIVWDYLPALA